MKICITGGTGFIGEWFTERLLREGAEVTALDLHPPSPGSRVTRFVQGDVRDPDALRRAFAGQDAVLALAAAHHDFGIDEATYFGVNEHASRLTCEALDACGIRRACWFSSVAVYGDCPAPRDEQSTPRPNNFYGASKLAGEAVWREWAALGGGRSALVIRPTICFGPRNLANMYSLIRQIHRRRFVVAGDGVNRKSLAYVENLVDATMHLWARHGEGFDVFNFVEKPDLKSREIAQAVADALGRRSAGVRLPMWLVLLAARPFDLVIALTGWNLPVSSMRVRKLFQMETLFEAEKLAAAGFRSRVSIREGIRRMAEWYLAEGKDRAVTWRQPPAEVRRFPST
ncbi:MAG: NAD(P)-dependent oxidoreductase [Phycisphaerae bacterium]|nr:NAD(P)-dependent oxidoreductase [Phycisphaerae bacterium]